jgi:hypothetical protein
MLYPTPKIIVDLYFYEILYFYLFSPFSNSTGDLIDCMAFFVLVSHVLAKHCGRALFVFVTGHYLTRLYSHFVHTKIKAKESACPLSL